MTQAVMELEARKARFIQRFLTEINNEEDLDAMISCLGLVLDGNTSHLPPYNVEELQERLRKSEEDIAAGRVRTHEEVVKEMESKFPWLCS